MESLYVICLNSQLGLKTKKIYEAKDHGGGNFLIGGKTYRSIFFKKVPKRELELGNDDESQCIYDDKFNYQYFKNQLPKNLKAIDIDITSDINYFKTKSGTHLKTFGIGDSYGTLINTYTRTVYYGYHPHLGYYKRLHNQMMENPYWLFSYIGGAEKYIGRHSIPISDSIEIIKYTKEESRRIRYDKTYGNNKFNISIHNGTLSGISKYSYESIENKLVNIADKKNNENIVIPEREINIQPTGLKDIAHLLSREQDKAIRESITEDIIITGPAGSGKTNILFHRLDYILSEYSEKFKQEDIAIFCFNIALKKYLGDIVNKTYDKVKIYSIDKKIRSMISNNFFIEKTSYNEDDINKSGELFIFIKKFTDKIYDDNLKENSILLQNGKLDGMKLLKLFYSSKQYGDYLNNNKQQEYFIKKNELNRTDLVILLIIFIILAMKLEILEKQKKNILESAYFSHIMVDEVQDLFPIHIVLLKQLNKGSLTLVGDLTQSLREKNENKDKTRGMGIKKILNLDVTYRNPTSIVLFAKEFLNKKGGLIAEKATSVGKKPCVYVLDDNYDNLIKKINSISSDKSIVITSPTNDSLDKIYSILSNNSIKSYIAKKDTWDFERHIHIASYQQIKGLEFDYVFILGLEDYLNGNYYNKNNVIYTVITRAVENVFIFSKKNMKLELSQINPDLYERK